MEEHLKWLKMLRTEAEDYFPDNESKRAGYIEALDEVIEEVTAIVEGKVL